MYNVRKHRFSVLLILLACLGLETGISHAKQLPKGVILQDGRQAYSLKLKNIDDVDFDLNQLKGKWVFVHFWASWCGPCRREMPTIQTLANKLKSLPIEIVLVNTAETEETVFTFLATVAPDLVPLLDPDGQVTEQWQPRGLPSTYLVDPQGKIRYLVLGGRDWGSEPYVKFMRSLPDMNKSGE